MCQVDKVAIALEVLRDIALDRKRLVAERQRAIDAITLFPASAIETLGYILRKTDLDVLKERSRLYIQRIESGTVLQF